MQKSILTNPNISIIEPLETVDFHNIMKRSKLILTDSGGIQEEAAYLRKPVLVLRDTTERPEGVKSGTLSLVGTNKDKIVPTTRELLLNSSEYKKCQQV